MDLGLISLRQAVELVRSGQRALNEFPVRRRGEIRRAIAADALISLKSYTELRKMAQVAEIPGYHKLKKLELVEAIKNANKG